MPSDSTEESGTVGRYLDKVWTLNVEEVDEEVMLEQAAIDELAYSSPAMSILHVALAVSVMAVGVAV